MTSVQTRGVRRIRHDVKQQPFMVIWEVTRACQLACRHCRADSIHVRDPGELSTDEGKTLFDQIASFGKPHPIMILTGGDPFERPDLAELTAYGSGVGLHMALSPSATPSVTVERLAEMREAGASAMSLSLDGARAETHDAFRGFAGTYERTLTSAALVNEAGFRLQVNTTVTTHHRARAARALPADARPARAPVEPVFPRPHRPRAEPGGADRPTSARTSSTGWSTSPGTSR